MMTEGNVVFKTGEMMTEMISTGGITIGGIIIDETTTD